MFASSSGKKVSTYSLRKQRCIHLCYAFRSVCTMGCTADLVGITLALSLETSMHWSLQSSTNVKSICSLSSDVHEHVVLVGTNLSTWSEQDLRKLLIHNLLISSGARPDTIANVTINQITFFWTVKKIDGKDVWTPMADIPLSKVKNRTSCEK